MLGIKSAWSAIIAMAAIAVVVSSPLRANSLSVEPLFIEMKPGGSGAIRVRNASDKPITVELSVAERQVNDAGEQTRTDAEDTFILLPPQSVIPPQQVQIFRMQPLEVDTQKSRSFFVTVRQLPVNLEPLEGGGTRLQVVFAFDVAAHTVPNGAESKMELVSTAPSTMEVAQTPADENVQQVSTSGKSKVKFETVPAVAVTVRNTGNKYMYLHDFFYTGTATDATGKALELPEWDSNSIVDAAQVSLVQPGATRTFKLPLRGMPDLKTVNLKVRPRANTGL
jgi:fimbrial chaperone protein